MKKVIELRHTTMQYSVDTDKCLQEYIFTVKQMNNTGEKTLTISQFIEGHYKPVHIPRHSDRTTVIPIAEKIIEDGIEKGAKIGA